MLRRSDLSELCDPLEHLHRVCVCTCGSILKFAIRTFVSSNFTNTLTSLVS